MVTTGRQASLTWGHARHRTSSVRASRSASVTKLPKVVDRLCREDPSIRLKIETKVRP